MARGLPAMVYSDGIGKRVQVKFGGYNHNAYAGEGEIWDMENMGSDLYPILAPRRERRHIATYEGKANGYYRRDGLSLRADGEKLFKNDEELSAVTDTRKQFIPMGTYVIILPDKLCYNTKTEEIKPMEAEWTGSAKIQDGTFAGEDAKANTIYAEGADWGAKFQAGDAVTIEGCEKHKENNTSIIIREIDGDYLRFYENSFILSDGGDEEGNLTIKRSVPDMDFMCENENRLWGCRGDTIYASKLGDPFNWNVFDGISTDSFAVDVGSAGDFTGCFAFLGYPCFFKEEHIYKVYGDRPANFQVMGSASLGVTKGSGQSMARAGEVLFYLSRIGICAYTGGMPQSVATPFGEVKYKNAVAGSDGVKYYVSMEDGGGTHHLFVYDTQKNLWHREDNTAAISFAWDEGRLYCQTEKDLWYYGEDGDEEIESFAEFGDFTDGDPNKKGTSKLQLRLELDEGAELAVKMQFDSEKVWHEVKTLSTTAKRSFYLPIVPRRADHFRLRLEGKGRWRLYSMTRESYSGSEF